MLDCESEIVRLKDKLNAVILAHFYQESEIQDVADFVGDSLALAQEAERTKADVIVFCGVHFMAETAKILNPTKLVLLPDLEAGCSLSDQCPPGKFRHFVDKHPGHFVVTYVNSSAAVKAMSDVIVTSSNAAKIVARISTDKPIIFAPDQHLGRYVTKQTGREMVLWPGSCIVHETFSERRIVELKVEHPAAMTIAHPECEAAVLRHADFIGSTKQLLEYSASSDAQSFIVVTEPGIIHQMQLRSPKKEFIPAPAQNGCACNECPHMRRNTMEKLYIAMRDLRPSLEIPAATLEAAKAPLMRMLAWS